MDIERVKQAIADTEVCILRAAPGIKEKEVIIERTEQSKDGKRTFGIGYFVSDPTKKLCKFDIRYIDKQRKINEPTPFPDERREELEAKEKRRLETYGVIGEHIDTLRWMFINASINNVGKTMMFSTLRFPKDKKGISAPTTRFDHSANIGRVAYRLAEILEIGNTKQQLGIAFSAQNHDLGHNPFGHEAETAKKKVLEEYGGGISLHEPEGAVKTRYRYEKAIKEGILLAPVIREARRIINEENKRNGEEKTLRIDSSIEYIERVNKKINELLLQINRGDNQLLLGEINNQKAKYGPYLEEVIRLMEMAAGSHDGERGVPHIIPDYSIEYKDYWEKIFKTFLNKDAKKELGVGNIGAAIARITDQISYIVFDMIDGIRVGIESEIPEEWIEPVANILKITYEDAKQRLNGDDEDRYLLVLETQDRIIEDIADNSNSREINMSDRMKELLYAGLRAPNHENHILRSSSKEEEQILRKLFLELTDKMVNSIVDEKGAFNVSLNDLFHVSGKNKTRKNKEQAFIKGFQFDNDLKEFLEYCAQTTSEEYDFYKKLAIAGEIDIFRPMIEDALKDRLPGGYVSTSGYDRGSIEFAIRSVIGRGSIDIIEPQSNGEYTDDQILDMINRINVSLRAKPIEGVKNLDFIVNREKQGLNGTIIQTRAIGRDERIAARIALGFLGSLTENEIVDLGKRLKILSDDEIEVLKKPYSTEEEHSSTESTDSAASNYDEARDEMNEYGEHD